MSHLKRLECLGETYQVRLKQMTSFGPQPSSICRLISTGKSRNDFGILRSVAVSMGTGIYLEMKCLRYDVKSARLYQKCSGSTSPTCSLSRFATGQHIEHPDTRPTARFAQIKTEVI